MTHSDPDPPSDAERPSASTPVRNLGRILDEVRAGRIEGSDTLLPLVYDELRVLARQCMIGERADHTLDATALVHEAYLRLSGSEEIAWESRAHFFGAAAVAMRRILVEHARKRGRKKRGGGQRRVALDVVDLLDEADPEEVLAVEQAVDRLCALDERTGRIVHLRFYAGLSVEETAAALSISERTVRREWTLARAWLMRELSG